MRATVSAPLWGFAGWRYFESAGMLPRLLIPMILMGLNAGGARSLASVPAILQSFVAASLTPILFRFALSTGGSAGGTLAIITFTYALFLINIARLHHADLHRLWRLVFENETLVVTPSEAKERADAANQAKGGFLATMSAEQRSQVEIASASAETLMRVLNVSSGAATASIRFSVHDTGIGIDEATREKLFGVFTQGDRSMNRRFGGSGLGLAISQRLVQHRGGQIITKSTPGRGSEFSFEVTLTTNTAAPEPVAAKLNTPPRLLHGRLLVVEDDRVNQQVIQLLLQNLGIESVLVNNGAAAVVAVSSVGADYWDAILMDCQLPGMDGFEATRHIRSHLGAVRSRL